MTSTANSIIGRNRPSKHKDHIRNRYTGVYIYTNWETGEQYIGNIIYLYILEDEYVII